MGAFDFQTKMVDGNELYKQVLEISKSYENSENLMYVVGATKATFLMEIRKIIPDSFLAGTRSWGTRRKFSRSVQIWNE